jgi:cyclophilin family peptidyl-prolyl cis-trans isomerase
MTRILKGMLCIAALFFVTTATAQVKKKAPVKKKPVSAVVKKPVHNKADSTSKEHFTRVKITTAFGDMVVKLYNKTPKHRDNFIKLVDSLFYDSLLFHRVINGFMVQGGDPQSKHADANAFLGAGDIGYTIPAEFDSSLFHKKGALCAARTENPEKASSGCQFYIVQGRKSSDGELDGLQMQRGLRYTPAQRMTYKMNGGTPFLDMNYTVFGEVESGMEVIDKIAVVPTNGSNRPLSDVRMKMEVIKEETTEKK